MSRRSVILSQLFALSFLNGFQALQHRIIFTNITSAVEPNFGNISFTLVDSKVSFYFYNKHTIANAIMTVELNVKTADYGTYTNFFNKRMNLCEFLANPNLDPLLYIGLKALLKDKRNHIITKCPIKAVKKSQHLNRYGTNLQSSFNLQGYYYVKDFSLDITDVPLPVHSLNFIFLYEMIAPDTNQSLPARIEGRVQTVSRRPKRRQK